MQVVIFGYDTKPFPHNHFEIEVKPYSSPSSILKENQEEKTKRIKDQVVPLKTFPVGRKVMLGEESAKQLNDCLPRQYSGVFCSTVFTLGVTCKEILN